MGFALSKSVIFKATKYGIYAPIDSGWSVTQIFRSLASKSAVKAVNCSSLSFKIS